MRAALALTAAVAALAFSLPANAHPVPFTATLSGPAEAPPNASPGTGFTTVTLDLDAMTLRVEATFSGLVAGTTASHIHCCVAAPGAVGVATTTPSFVGFPLGVTSGTFDNTLSLTDAGSFNPAFVTLAGGLAGAAAMLATGITNGTAYLNIHTSTFPGGEIRGFLTPAVVAIPEPETYLLLLAGLGLIGAVGKRRRLRS